MKDLIHAHQVLGLEMSRPKHGSFQVSDSLISSRPSRGAASAALQLVMSLLLGLITSCFPQPDTPPQSFLAPESRVSATGGGVGWLAGQPLFLMEGF